jgi:hypothetical protein
MSDNRLVISVQTKIQETLDRTSHLIAMLPPDKLDWRPAGLPNSFTLGYLLGHLLECTAGICAVLHKTFPEKLDHFLQLRSQPVNHSCTPSEALTRVSAYSCYIEEGFRCFSDSDLSRVVPSYFAPEGETVLTLLLGNLEHLINHKYQLFFYLKLIGIKVGSPDLYRFRQVPEAGKGAQIR